MAYEINWTVTAGDPVLVHPLYQKYSNKPNFASALLPEVQADLLAVAASLEGAAVANYLCWVIRVLKLAA